MEDISSSDEACYAIPSAKCWLEDATWEAAEET
jgi:hypothetical protein